MEQVSADTHADPANAESHVWHVDTSVGRLAVIERDGAVTRLLWHRDSPGFSEIRETPLLKEATSQLAAYFDGRLTKFDLPLTLSRSAFERRVQEAMLAIPHGETRTYGDIAKELDTYGQPVGQACGNNAIPIIVPCHRVLSANGLGGFSGEGGVEMKIRLLKHEGGYPFLL
ncbi:MAG: methylated-DNA--[protein]-cysteine S-methyltransferase [Alphaproteobacteria bacterium]|nr:methylated-DNA--[protein]-cysteine S-methyltransferase [Alphaproteobacteria bacterium]